MIRIFNFSIIFISLCLFGCDRDNISNDPPDGPKISLNLHFDVVADGTSFPKGWSWNGEGYKFSLDSVEKHGGKYSLKMERTGKPDNFAQFSSSLLNVELVRGKTVEYKGWIKTKGLKNNESTGLYFRVNGKDGTSLGFGQTYYPLLQGDNDWKQVSIKIDVSPQAESVTIAGLFYGEGTVWFDDLELFVDGVKCIDDNDPKTTLTEKEKTTLKKYIYPLRTFEPDGGDSKDLNVLNALIGNSKVVALGENTHGSSEIFKMKDRIIQYLATNNNFDIFSIEANMPESYKLNDYTIRGEGDPKKLIAGMYFWTWNTTEMLHLVEWMHKFNQPTPRIEYTGFDMQYYQGSIDELFDAFKGNDEIEDNIIALKKILDIIRARQLSSGTFSVNDNEKTEIDSLLSILSNRIETSSFQDARKKWLLQNILIIQQYSLLANSTGNWRDKCMADNFVWIKNQNPGSKFVIWAHNRHIWKVNQCQGYYLSQYLGADYVTFGFSFFDGRYTAAGGKYNATTAYPGTLEYYLEQLKEPVFILDLKKIKADNPKDLEWMTGQIEFRGIGSVGGLPNEFFNTTITNDFDYLIYIKTSTPSTLLQ